MNNITRRNFLKALGATAAGVKLSGCATTASRMAGGKSPDRPNIIIIMADDMGYSDIGCYGSEISTPNLDHLARQGLRFKNFYNTARCCPTRASLLTGLYAHQAGVGHMTRNDQLAGYQGFLADRCVTIGEVLQIAGYRTLLAGKWHVGSKRDHWPRERGFDRFYGVPQGGGFYFTLRQGRNVVLDDEPVELGDNWYITNAITDHALDFMDESRRMDKPFFLYMAYTAPHWPLQALPKDIEKYKGKYDIGWDEIRRQRHQRMIEMGLIDERWGISQRDTQTQPWDELEPDKKEDMSLRMAIYAAQIDRMDQNIGRIIQNLKAHGELDNTLVMFLADNGGCAEGGPFGFNRNKKGPLGSKDSFASYGLSWANASNTPFRRYKHWVHEGGIATPLVVHWPNVIKKTGGFTSQKGHVIDLMATCCDVAKAKYPTSYKGNNIIPLEGQSLLPIFQGQKRKGHEAIYFEHEGNRSVIQGSYKLVSKFNSPWELYDLETDRCELLDLTLQKPQLASKLEVMYEAWARRSDVIDWGQLQKHRKKQKEQIKADQSLR